MIREVTIHEPMHFLQKLFDMNFPSRAADHQELFREVVKAIGGGN